jgi:hypothetical protein
MPSDDYPYHDGLSQPNRRPLRIGGLRIERFTIPLVYDGRFFLIERSPDAAESWTVFQLPGAGPVVAGPVVASPVVECLRGVPCEGRAVIDPQGNIVSEATVGDSPLYRISTTATESIIEVAGTDDALYRFEIVDGRIGFGGFISGTYYDGDVPIGMYLDRNGAVRFRCAMPSEFNQLLE